MWAWSQPSGPRPAPYAERMTRPASRAAPRAAKVIRAATRAHTRRHDYSSSTRRSLVACATELFTERGYAGTSLDEVVSAAQVTKGAL